MKTKLLTLMLALSMVLVSITSAGALSIAGSDGDPDDGLSAAVSFDLTGTTSLTGAPTADLSASVGRSTVQITYNGQTVDTLNGVPAKYVTYSSNTGTYCCAQYVKNYYSTIYGVSVYNLLTGRTPLATNAAYTFKSISSGFRVGDIVYHLNSSGSGHWAIVKAVSGNTVTLIEQNWKWSSGGKYYTYVNRTVTYGQTRGMKVYRLYKNGVDANGGGTPTPIVSTPTSNTAVLESLLFNADVYYALNPDVAAVFGHDTAKLLNHWKTCGQGEGRVASILFDAKFYLSCNPDVARAFGSTNYKAAYDHFLNYGFWEGRQGSPIYGSQIYLGLYPDLKAAFGSNYLLAAQHFVNTGVNELRQASSLFSVKVYSEKNADVARAYPKAIDRIIHYIAFVQYGNEYRACI